MPGGFGGVEVRRHGLRLTPGAGRAADAEVTAAVADAHRREWAFVLAATVRVTRDLDLAEECVQDAYARRCRVGRSRHPGQARRLADHDRPAAGVRPDPARRHAARALPLLVEDDLEEPPEFDDDTVVVARRPAAADLHLLPPGAGHRGAFALTLRLVCGLTTAEVARAFLVSEPTMAARITRAKKKIASARIPYRVPSPAELPARVDSVLTVVHLVFTTGHTAPIGDRLVRGDLVERALDLARMLRGLLPRMPTWRACSP